MRVVPATLLGLTLLLGSGCGEDIGELAVATPDRMAFQQDVYPILLRDCAFHACHGSYERFFQVFGPGRGRLTPLLRPLDLEDPAEVEHSYERAISMIDTADPENSLLLRKPLAVSAGGAGHEGTDIHGRDVYDSAVDPSFTILKTWALAMGTGGPMLPGAAPGATATPGAPGPTPAPGAP